jgi:hypothetical protein
MTCLKEQGIWGKFHLKLEKKLLETQEMLKTAW